MHVSTCESWWSTSSLLIYQGALHLARACAAAKLKHALRSGGDAREEPMQQTVGPSRGRFKCPSFRSSQTATHHPLASGSHSSLPLCLMSHVLSSHLCIAALYRCDRWEWSPQQVQRPTPATHPAYLFLMHGTIKLQRRSPDSGMLCRLCDKLTASRCQSAYS